MPPEGSANPDSRSTLDAAAKRRTEAEYRIGWKMAAVGMEVASMVVGGALLGWGAEALFGWSYSILVGSLLGLAVGMWTLIKGALKLNRELDAMGPRKIARREQPAVKPGPEVPSWREDWEDWKEDDADERAD